MSEVKRVRLEYDVQRIEALKKLNDEFLLVKIYAMAPGKNRNFTYISKSDVETAIPSAYYCPVVGHIRVYVDPDGVEHAYMGSHDFDITDDWEIKDVTRPYGVIVENSEGWETIDEHGTEVEYLTFNAILWVGRYPELNEAAYSDEILFNQSMEINIENYRPLDEDSNYWEVLGFTFSAFCLLGKADEDSTNGHTDKSEHTEPAFISAKVVAFGLDEFKKEFALLKDKINQFCLADVTANDAKGESMADEKIVDTAATEFDSAVEGKVEPTVDEQVGEKTAEIVEDTVDPTTEEEAVAEEGTQEEPVETPDYEAMYNEIKNAYDGVIAQFEEYKASHSHGNDEYQALVDYKAQREQSDRDAAESELFASFESISGTDEYAELKGKASEYSLDDLKLRLYAIVGMKAKSSVDENKKDKLMKFSLGGGEPQKTEADPYGNAREIYG